MGDVFMHNPEEVKIRVGIINPYMQHEGFTLSVSSGVWNSAMGPLAKNHDVPFLYQERKMAAEQLLRRHELCQDLGRMFADKMEQMVAAKDPKNGYEKELLDGEMINFKDLKL
jgi:hypothetical protein